MSQALQISADIKASPASFAEFIGAVADTDRELDQVLREGEAALHRVEISINEIDAVLLRAVEQVEVWILEGSPEAEKYDYDIAIDQAEKTDRELREIYGSSAKLIDKVSRLIKKISPKHAAATQPLLARAKRMMNDHIASTNDIKWRLMVARAEKQKAEKGEVFQDPKKLARHLVQATE